MKNIWIAITLVFTTLISACGDMKIPGNLQNPVVSDPNDRESSGDETQPDPSLPNDSNPGLPPAYKYEPLSWEKQKDEAKNKRAALWSVFAMKLIKEKTDLLDGSDDVETFCPKYRSLNDDQKANFWVGLISGMSKYESSYNPLSRMQETTMGTDPITRKPVYSEGLLQLSYQDIQGYTFCKFDWNKDKYLSVTDPNKTILDPYINLDCGIKILNHQIQRKKKIVLGRGVYWAVLRSTSDKVPEIRKITRSLSFCR